MTVQHKQLQRAIPSSRLACWLIIHSMEMLLMLGGNNNDGVVAGATLTNDRFGASNAAYHFSGGSCIIIPNYFLIQYQLLPLQHG